MTKLTILNNPVNLFFEFDASGIFQWKRLGTLVMNDNLHSYDIESYENCSVGVENMPSSFISFGSVCCLIGC